MHGQHLTLCLPDICPVLYILRSYDEKHNFGNLKLFTPTISPTTGVQTFTIPPKGEGYYVLSAKGARGANAKEPDERYHGGKGATATGLFHFKDGDKLNVVVGQQAETCTKP